MSDPGETKPRKGAGRGVKIALAISLALNLAIVGLVAGAVIGRDREVDGSPALRSLGLGPFVIALDRDHRHELRRRLDADREVLGEDRRAIGRAMRDLQEILGVEPFDREAAEAAMAASRNGAIRLQTAGQTALLDQIEAMSVQERAELADSLDRVMRRFSNRRR